MSAADNPVRMNSSLPDAAASDADASAWREKFLESLPAPRADEPADLERLTLFIADELAQARGEMSRGLSAEEFRRISLLVMQDERWARLHASLLKQRLANEAS